MNDYKKYNVSVLTGAGASKALGYPLADDIHATLFEDKDVHYSSAGKFVSLNSEIHTTKSSKEKVAEVRATLRAVQVLCDSFSYYPTNYEEWYYIMDQVVSGPSMNLLVTPFIDKLKEFLPNRVSFETSIHFGDISGSYGVGHRCKEACGLVSDIVTEKLHIQPPEQCLHKLQWLEGMLNDSDISIQSIMTLNHDLVLEAAMKESGKDWADGFSNANNYNDEASLWEPELFDKENIPLLKLHGSSNWFKVYEKFRSDDRQTLRLGKIVHCKVSATPHKHINNDVDRMMLLGRHNKVSQYSAPVFNELHRLATQKLEKSNVLVIVGYSFGDIYINRMIKNWLYSGETKRLVLIALNEWDALVSLEVGIAKSQQEWDERDDLAVLASKSEELDWPRLRASIFS